MSEVTPVVPEGVDPLDGLTVGELGRASREMKADVISAALGVTHDGALRWDALARLAWLWARRADPGARLTTFQDYKAPDILRALRMDEAPTQSAEEQMDALTEPANPTEGSREPA